VLVSRSLSSPTCSTRLSDRQQPRKVSKPGSDAALVYTETGVWNTISGCVSGSGLTDQMAWVHWSNITVQCTACNIVFDNLCSLGGKRSGQALWHSVYADCAARCAPSVAGSGSGLRQKDSVLVFQGWDSHYGGSIFVI